MQMITADAMRVTAPKPFIVWLDKYYPEWAGMDCEVVTGFYAAWREGMEHMVKEVKAAVGR